MRRVVGRVALLAEVDDDVVVQASAGACVDLGSSRGPLPTYFPSPRALCAAIGAALEAIVASLVAFGPA